MERASERSIFPGDADERVTLRRITCNAAATNWLLPLFLKSRRNHAASGESAAIVRA
jgi:hypothetical protein